MHGGGFQQQQDRSCVEERGRIGTVRKVSVVSSLDMNVNSHLQMVSFTELGCGDGNPTNPVPVEDNGSLNVASANLPDELILDQANKILNVGGWVEEEQFSHKNRDQSILLLFSPIFLPGYSFL